eukprot:1385156-Amorphochlora_amoeboformis.AAC.1
MAAFERLPRHEAEGRHQPSRPLFASVAHNLEIAEIPGFLECAVFITKGGVLRERVSERGGR